MNERQHAAWLRAAGLTNLAHEHWNLDTPTLYEKAARRGEGTIASGGPIVCRTGHHTGRSPSDKFVVKEGLQD